MKATAPTLTVTAPVQRGTAAVFADLFKARLTFLVVLTTVVGFYLGTSGPAHWEVLAATLIGTALVASGAAALNQYIERKHDAQMDRTSSRPLPSGELQPGTVLLLGAAISVGGLGILALLVNSLTALLGAATLLTYLFVYTPLKRVTTLNTAIGAIPGALPPLMGWTAATDEISMGGWALFAILFFWQLPHFLAIAWLYREDYRKAGYAMLPVLDASGRKTGAQAVSHTLGLLPVSLAPVALKLVGPLYLAGALLAGLAMLWTAVRFARQLSSVSARGLFFASILYLPVLLVLMVVDKIKP
jgi:protoheme IX farnesyltransferase